MSFTRKGLSRGNLDRTRPAEGVRLQATGLQRAPLALIYELSHDTLVETSTDLRVWKPWGRARAGKLVILIKPWESRRFFRARVPWVKIPSK